MIRAVKFFKEIYPGTRKMLFRVPEYPFSLLPHASSPYQA